MIDIGVDLNSDMLGLLDGFEKDIKEKVLFSGVAAMGRVIYDEVKLNTSGVRATRQSPKFVGPSAPTPPGKVTGTLDSAIYRVYSPERSSEEVKTYRVSVNKSKAPHWYLIEYGTSKSAAHPYIRPAFDKVHAAINAGRARMSDRIDEVISEKAAGA